MKKVLVILLQFLTLVGYSGTINCHSSSAKPMQDTCKGNYLFKIAVKDFFQDPLVADSFIKNAVNADQEFIRMLYAPKSFCVKDDKVFIPDVRQGVIRIYDIKGVLQKVVLLPGEERPYYMDFMDNGHFVFTDPLVHKVVEADTAGKVIFKADCNPSAAFTIHDEDIYYFKKYKLCDSKGLLTSVLDLKPDVPENLLLGSTSNALTLLTDGADLFTLSLSGKNLQYNFIPKELSATSACLLICPQTDSLNRLLMLTSADTGNFIASVVTLKANKPLKKVSLVLPAVDREGIVWPDQGEKWPRGIEYYFEPTKGKLYSLYTDSSFIYLSTFDDCWMH